MHFRPFPPIVLFSPRLFAGFVFVEGVADFAALGAAEAWSKASVFDRGVVAV